MTSINNRTVAQNAVKLVLRQEREPVDTLLLVLPELGLDGDRYIVLLDLAAIQKLREELSLIISAPQEVV